jgi:hypothetical protein
MYGSHPQLSILQTKEELKDPWGWIIFCLFFICLVATVIAITLGFAAPTHYLLIWFVIIAAVSFVVAMVTLTIVILNQDPPPPPSLLEN